MLGLAIILFFNLIGWLLSAAGVSLPGPVIGLVLLAAALFLKLIKLAWVEPAADILLQHMLLFFAPVVVGVISQAEALGREWWQAAAVLVGSWLAVLLATGWSASLLLGRRNGGPDAA